MIRTNLDHCSPRLRTAFADDAMAIASWAEAQGFPEDAERMREFAARIRPAEVRQSWREVRVG